MPHRTTELDQASSSSAAPRAPSLPGDEPLSASDQPPDGDDQILPVPTGGAGSRANPIELHVVSDESDDEDAVVVLLTQSVVSTSTQAGAGNGVGASGSGAGGRAGRIIDVEAGAVGKETKGEQAEVLGQAAASGEALVDDSAGEGEDEHVPNPRRKAVRGTFAAEHRGPSIPIPETVIGDSEESDTPIRVTPRASLPQLSSSITGSQSRRKTVKRRIGSSDDDHSTSQAAANTAHANRRRAKRTRKPVQDPDDSDTEGDDAPPSPPPPAPRAMRPRVYKRAQPVRVSPPLFLPSSPPPADPSDSEDHAGRIHNTNVRSIHRSTRSSPRRKTRQGGPTPHTRARARVRQSPTPPDDSPDESDASRTSSSASSSGDHSDVTMSRWDSEDRDDLEIEVDSEAEAEIEVDSEAEAELEEMADDPILGGSDDERDIIIEHHGAVPALLQDANGNDLPPLRGEQDLIYTRLPLDPLPKAWARWDLDGFAFNAEHEPEPSDTDDDQERGDGDFNGDDSESDRQNESSDDESRTNEADAAKLEGDSKDDEDEVGRYPRRRRTPTPPADGAVGGGGDGGADEGGAGAGEGRPEEDEIKRAYRKHRAQMDAINFQRLVITIVFRIRNGAAASHDALAFLDQVYFVPSWQYLHDKVRYTSGCLERPDWKALRGVFKEYSEYRQNPISFSEHCEGCEHDHQGRCKSYTDTWMSGGYDDLTLAPKGKREICYALGTNCRTSFVEVFELYHQVARTAAQFEKDSFNLARISQKVERLLREDRVNIDKLVAYFARKGTDRKVMKTMHRVYSVINDRRLGWFDKRERMARDQAWNMAYRDDDHNDNDNGLYPYGGRPGGGGGGGAGGGRRGKRARPVNFRGRHLSGPIYHE